MKKPKEWGLTPWERSRPASMMSEIDRMLDDFRTEFESIFWKSPTETTMMRRSPLLDLADLGDSYEVTAEIPGVPKDKIEINVSEGDLEISAKSESEEKKEGKEYISREISYRSYYRKLALPEDVVPEKAKAKNIDGILKIELPKKTPKKKAEAHRLKIK
ncbi:MAG: Hsp20/alpha crystallin family protein [Thermoplasmata archaeon]